MYSASSESVKPSYIYYEKMAFNDPLQVKYNYWKEVEIKFLRQLHQWPIGMKNKIL